MNDIKEFIEKRRKSFKNPCFQIEPLYDWIRWASSNGSLYFSKTSDDMFDSIGIAWRVPAGNYTGSTINTFINEYDPTCKNYDLFILDFFAENRKSRNELIISIYSNNHNYTNVWAFRKGKLVKITNNYLFKLNKI